MSVNLRPFDDIVRERFDDENYPTKTSEEQQKVEESIEDIYDCFSNIAESDSDAPLLLRRQHENFLKTLLRRLPKAYQCLDSSRPWLCYWILHSLELLELTLEPELISNVAQFLARCQCPDGGFGGGPGQYAHLAPTYAAVNALCTLGTEEAFSVIDREKLSQFLWSVKSPDGGFHMHVGGECDIRGVYCALAIAKLTNIYTDSLFENSAEWIVSCQTYEGGFSGCPDMEAHGGYTFCGLAALTILGRENLCNMKSLMRWAVNRQMRFEGGFQGRTNKLVDSCYSFWQCGIFPMIHRILAQEGTNTVDMERWLFHQTALQEYILVCCQDPSGGFVDKPSKLRDVYHTCYTLSGLSVAQHAVGDHCCIVGNPVLNEIAPVHPVYNISKEAYLNAALYFTKLPTVRSKPS